MAVADVDPVCARLQAVFTDSSPGHHLQVIGAAPIHIEEGAERQARLRNTSVSGAAWWTQMKACTNADLFGLGQAEQHRPGGHGVRVHGAPCGASRVMPNDVPVAAIHEEVDAAAGRTIVVRDPWDPLGNDGLHCAFGRLTSTAGSAKGREDVEVHEGLDGQRQVVASEYALSMASREVVAKWSCGQSLSSFSWFCRKVWVRKTLPSHGLPPG